MKNDRSVISVDSPYDKRLVRPFLRTSGQYGEQIGYSPQQLRHYYEFDERYGGKGITVGIVTAYGSPTLANDLAVFSRLFSLPQATLLVRGSENASATQSEWVLESSADSQMAHAFAPDATLVAYFAPSAELSSLLPMLRLADRECDIVSLSFGIEEFEGVSEYEDFFENAHALFVCAAGDRSVVNYPASSSHTLSVGGTRLYLDRRGDAIGSEIVWSESGCGISRFFSAPPYQARFADIAARSDGKRVVPDLSFFAWGRFGAAIYHSTPVGGSIGRTEAAGTSIGAPCVAGICACLMQKFSTVGIQEDFFYALAGGTSYANRFRAYRDIVLGRSGAFTATRGFDFCSGLGTPRIRRMLTHGGTVLRTDVYDS